MFRRRNINSTMAFGEKKEFLFDFLEKNITMKVDGKFYGYYMNMVCLPPYNSEEQNQELDECLKME